MPAKRLVLGLLWIAFFVAYLDRTNISVAGPAMMHDLGMSPQTFGYVLASFTAGYALVQIPGGWLADRFGAKIMLLIALLIWSAFTGLTDVAVSVGALIAIRVCFGLGEGLEQGAQFKAIGDTFPSPERSAASGIFLTALALGPAFVAPVAAATIARAGWQTLFLWFTVPASSSPG
jgi:MFS family permease